MFLKKLVWQSPIAGEKVEKIIEKQNYKKYEKR